MIAAFIFLAHIVFLTTIFIKKWKRESLTSGFLNAILIIILFTIGWSLSAMVVKLIFPLQGLSKEFNLDTLALISVSLGEIVFYKFYYKSKDPTAAEKEIQ
ncbi:hypothetical protein BMS3Abin04_00509 [bacterium BMS3Abin04]|nr:hypothetical protein BMS3Abin04_00509 [bacterium BMS3Abin04]